MAFKWFADFLRIFNDSDRTKYADIEHDGDDLTISDSVSVTGDVTASGALNGATAAVTGNATFDTTTLVVDAVNNRVGVVNATPSYALDVTGSMRTSVNLYLGNAAGKIYTNSHCFIGNSTNGFTDIFSTSSTNYIQSCNAAIDGVQNLIISGRNAGAMTLLKVYATTSEFTADVDVDGNLNVDGTATIDGDVIFSTAGGGLAYGQISVIGNTTATTISSSATPVQVTIFDTNGPYNQTTPDHTTDDITIINTGVYLINVSATIDVASGTANKCALHVKKNNGASSIIPLSEHNFAGAGGEAHVFSLSGIASLTAADTVEVWIENETGTDNYTVENICLSVVQIGG